LKHPHEISKASSSAQRVCFIKSDFSTDTDE
jgi:hypothetical protein